MTIRELRQLRGVLDGCCVMLAVWMILLVAGGWSGEQRAQTVTEIFAALAGMLSTIALGNHVSWVLRRAGFG